MSISIETTNLLLDINNFSEDFIKNNYEISLLVEETFTKGDRDKFEKLIFTGKYLYGLRSILAKKSIGDKSTHERLDYEFKLNFEKLIMYLKIISNNSDSKTKKYLQQKYLALTQESLSNVMNLIDDLSLIKKYFNAKDDL
jgi:hypothetical protein